jgi:hypothetical protein
VDPSQRAHTHAGLKRPREVLSSAAQQAAAARSALERGRAEVGKIWTSVAALGAAGFEGSQRKQWESSQLSALGVKLKGKAQKMPFKMFLGVSKARAARAAKAEEEARVSGAVRPGGAGKKKKRRGPREEDPEDMPVPENIRGPVMHVGGGGGGGGGRRR